MRRLACLIALLAGSCSTTPSPAPLPAQLTIGDTTVRPRADGSFDLVVGGRTLLSAQPAPITLRNQHTTLALLWGLFDYETGIVVKTQLDHTTAARVGDGAITLSLAGANASGTLRFDRLPDEVTLTLHATATPAVNSIDLHFACTPTSHFLGFGEQYEHIDHRGEAFPLWTSEQGVGRDPSMPNPFSGNPWTTYFPVPFFLDPSGFGVALDTNAHAAVDLCSTVADTYTLTADETGDLVVHVYTGPTVADVLSAFTVRQGRSLPPPRWAVDGVWIGVQGGPARVLQVVDTAMTAGAPVAAVWVQDWIGRLDLGGGLYDLQYHWTADTTLYPDLPGLIKQLNTENVHFLGYFNPFITPDHDQWQAAVANGYTVKTGSGDPYQVLISVYQGSMLDTTNPDAVAWFQGFAKQALAMGQDGWMDDYGEWLPYDAVLKNGAAPLVHNQYPAQWHQASLSLLSSNQVLLSRSGWLGAASTSQVVWAGDQQADWDPWDGLPTVVPALISLGLAGIGWPTHDVAGFTGGPSTKELYLRWMELAAFTPIFRTHEGLDSGNNWYWYSDAETLTAFSRLTRIHAALADTFEKWSDVHQSSGMPIVRALALQYPDDAQAIPVSDEFMIGDDILVAPVSVQGAVTRNVYFPKGHWISLWDATQTYDGPLSQMVAAPIGQPPAFSISGRTDLAAIH